MAATARPTIRHWVIWSIALVIGSTIIARAQVGGGSLATAARQEFLSQEVQADAIVETLNDLSKNGWEVFQILPTWKLNNADGAEASLVVKSYQVFGRRPAK